MEENLNKSSNETDFILDTSAFLSLESVYLLEKVLNTFPTITTFAVIHELNDFSEYNDELGRIAQRVLKLKHLFNLEESQIKHKLDHVSATDEELFNLASSQNIPLLTDDTKLVHHTKGKIVRAFSTVFLKIFVDAELLTKAEALEKLETMRHIRNWQENIIYISTKEELMKV